MTLRTKQDARPCRKIKTHREITPGREETQHDDQRRHPALPPGHFPAVQPVRRPLHLQNMPEPAYTCAGSTNQTEPCQALALLAEDLNRHLLSQVFRVIITDSTFHAFGAAVVGALAEAGHEDAEAADEICVAPHPSRRGSWHQKRHRRAEKCSVDSSTGSGSNPEPPRSSTGCRCPRELRWPARSARPSSCRNRYGPDPELRAYSSGPKSEPDWARR